MCRPAAARTWPHRRDRHDRGGVHRALPRRDPGRVRLRRARAPLPSRAAGHRRRQHESGCRSGRPNCRQHRAAAGRGQGAEAAGQGSSVAAGGARGGGAGLAGGTDRPRSFAFAALEGWDANGLKQIATAIVARPGHVAVAAVGTAAGVVVIARSADVGARRRCAARRRWSRVSAARAADVPTSRRAAD